MFGADVCAAKWDGAVPLALVGHTHCCCDEIAWCACVRACVRACAHWLQWSGSVGAVRYTHGIHCALLLRCAGMVCACVRARVFVGVCLMVVVEWERGRGRRMIAFRSGKAS